MNDERFKLTDIDREIDRMNAKEVKILEREWVDEQKKKLLMQQALRNKMDQMMQTHHSSMMGQYNKFAMPSSPIEEQNRLKADSRLKNKNDSQLGILTEEQRIKQVIAKKNEIEKQNAIIAKTYESENLAIISRYADLVKANRIESVRLP